MALGAGSVTPMQMAAGYAVFANGGYRVNPYLITKITDQKGKVLVDAKPTQLNEDARAISSRNAFIMNNLLQEVARSGTAAKAQQQLGRPDLFGKTGTTNDAIDTWFAGFQPTLAAVVWMGYDTPRKLGDNETGGGLSLPIWITYMQTALKNVAVTEYSPPEGVVNVGGEWFYNEYVKGSGVSSLGLEDKGNAPSSEDTATAPAPEEKQRILDFFKN
jgi:penicillin-binding protein 1A